MSTASITRWEYHFYPVPSLERTVREVAELGAEGWEAVGMTPVGLLFKRPAENGSTPSVEEVST